jgi:fibronectin-binding autotransporter adhesin
MAGTLFEDSIEFTKSVTLSGGVTFAEGDSPDFSLDNLVNLTGSGTATFAAFVADAVPTASAAVAMVLLGDIAITGGAAAGTFLGANTDSATTSDYINFQNNDVVKLRCTSAGNLTCAGTFGVTGAATVGGTLGITGATTCAALTASGTLAASAAATVGTTLGVTGATTLSSTLAVTGVITATTHYVSTDGNITLTNGTVSAEQLTTTDDLTVGSDAAITGAATVGTTLGVTGILTAAATGGPAFIASGMPAAATTSSLARLGDTAITGGAAAGTYLGINSAAAITHDFVDFQNDDVIKFRITSAGNVTCAGTLGVTGAATVGGTLGVTGTSTLAAASATTLTASTSLVVTGATVVGLHDYLHIRIQNLVASDAKVYGINCPVAGTITRIGSCLNGGALAAGNATITGKIASTGITTGVITIAEAGSAAGDLDSCSPSAANVVAVGDYLNFTVGGANTDTAAFADLTITVLRSA